nr:SEC-C domain-containing protein [Oceanococcus sp. HetDA_MAG_MS8]
MNTSVARSDQACLCGSGRTYARCCQPLHRGEPAPSAEALMRSRYTAYALALDDYVLRSWHPRTRPASIEHEPGTRWLGLRVKSAQQSAADQATVRFEARYRVGGRPAVRMRETSRFVCEGEHWYYLDGDIHS